VSRASMGVGVLDGSLSHGRPRACVAAWESGGRARQLRVVLVAPPYFDVPPSAYGGVEAVVADLADALTARGHQVTLIGAGTARTAARFVPVWDRTVPERLGQPYPEVMHALAVRRAVQRLAEAEAIDIVHDHTLAGPLNAEAYARLGAATVVTAHGPVDEDMRRSPPSPRSATPSDYSATRTTCYAPPRPISRDMRRCATRHAPPCPACNGLPPPSS
jgi:Glycosyltransferase Family 4